MVHHRCPNRPESTLSAKDMLKCQTHMRPRTFTCEFVMRLWQTMFFAGSRRDQIGSDAFNRLPF